MTELSREYGDGLYALCAEEKIEAEVLDELKALLGVLKEQPDFIRLLSNMSLPKAERLSILDSALRGQVHPYVLNFLKLLLERSALHELNGCEQAYRENFNRDHRVLEARVTTGAPLDNAQRERLLEKLRSMTGKTVVLSEQVDSAVLGGAILEMDGKRYDNTVRHRLEAIHRSMTGDE